MDYEGWKYLCSVGVRSKVQDEANVWTLIPEPSKLSCRGKHNQLRRSPRHSRQDSNTMWKINTDQPQCIPMSGQCEDERRGQRGQLSWAEWTQHAVTPPGVLHPAGVQPQWEWCQAGYYDCSADHGMGLYPNQCVSACLHIHHRVSH